MATCPVPITLAWPFPVPPFGNSNKTYIPEWLKRARQATWALCLSPTAKCVRTAWRMVFPDACRLSARDCSGTQLEVISVLSSSTSQLSSLPLLPSFSDFLTFYSLASSNVSTKKCWMVSLQMLTQPARQISTMRLLHTLHPRNPLSCVSPRRRHWSCFCL